MSTTRSDPGGAEPAEVRTSPPVQARAWWGDRLVAASSSAVPVERPGEAPILLFPPSDVRFDLFRTEEPDPAEPGTQRWSIDGTASAPAGGWSATSAFGAAAVTDGVGVLRRFGAGPPSIEDLADHAVFDHDRVRVEVVDGREGDDPRDVTVKRFPTWGDAAHLIDLLDVRSDGPRRAASTTRANVSRPVVEGSQILGQAMVGASREFGGRRVVSAHMVFARAADGRAPLQFAYDPVADGRTFTALAVEVAQGDRRCATGTMLLDERAPDLIRHEVAPPDVPGPYECSPYDMSVTGRDLRIVDDAYTGDPDAPIGPPVLDAWVRFREVPDEPCLHAGLVAQFTGHLSIAAALRPHAGIGQQGAHHTLSTAINAIAISFHAEPRADRWLLYRHLSTFAGDGMSHSECRVHDEAGHLVASFTVDAMIRAFAGAAPTDGRTAL